MLVCILILITKLNVIKYLFLMSHSNKQLKVRQMSIGSTSAPRSVYKLKFDEVSALDIAVYTRWVVFPLATPWLGSFSSVQVNP